MADDSDAAPPGARALRTSRILLGGAAVALAATTLAERIDFFRRHVPGATFVKFFRPQLLQIWLPGLTLTAVLTVLGLASRRRSLRRLAGTGKAGG